MKLTLQELKKMVKGTIAEESRAKKNDKDGEKSKSDEVEETLDGQTDIMRFHEECPHDLENGEAEDGESDLEGLAARAMAAVHDLAAAAGADLSTTVDTGEELGDEDEHADELLEETVELRNIIEEELTATIQQEIFKGLGKKISGKVADYRADKQQGKKNAAERKRVKDHFDKTGECPEGYKEYGAGNCQTAIPDLDISGDLERAGGSKYTNIDDTDREIRDSDRWAKANTDQRAAMMAHNRAQRGLEERVGTLKKLVRQETLKALKK